jgi:hypothetical protein
MSGFEEAFNGSQQGLLMDKLAVNASGTVAIVNSSFQPGTRSAVWLTTSRPIREKGRLDP